MNKKWMAAAMLVTTATASQAQSGNVAVYGLIDAGVEHVTNVGPAGDGLTRMPTLTGSIPSRIGFRGTEDLGNGLKAFFTLENGLSLDTGVAGQGGRLFGRQALVGISGAWGAVTLGRQYNMYFYSLLDADILGPNLYGSASVDSYIPNAREDNAVGYRGTFGGLTVGATYSLGRDGVNAGPSPAGTNCAGESASDKAACRAWSALLKYDRPNWGVATAYDRQNGGPAAFAGLTSSALRDTRTVLDGYVKLGALKLAGGVIRRDNEGAATPRTDLYFAGATYGLTGAVTLDVQAFRLNVKQSSNAATLLAVRATYKLSQRTAGYVTVGNISNDGNLNISVSSGAPGSNPAAGSSQKGMMVGMRHAF
ncbi:MAG: porin [Telluria sp.]|nr:porin [Telluria sp.]